MPVSTWLFYVAAVPVLTVTPGPSVLMCVSISVRLGMRKALVVAYLAYLGLSALLSPVQEIPVAGSGASRGKPQRRLWTQGFFVGASNPKARLFFWRTVSAVHHAGRTSVAAVPGAGRHGCVFRVALAVGVLAGSKRGAG